MKPGLHNSPRKAQEKFMPNPRPVNYFGNEGLRPELVNEHAEEVARGIKRMNTSQLRRFYDDAKVIERRILLGRDKADQERIFNRQRAMIAMLKANAAYGNKRSGNVVPDEFLQFIVDHVAAVKTLADFRAFMKHFEAVVAFHRFYAEEK